MAFRSGYGLGGFSSGLYGIDSVLVVGAVSASISSATSAVCNKVMSFSATATITTTASGIGFTALAGASTATLTTTTALYWNRIRPFSASDSASVGTSVNSRYKWINAQDPTTSWTQADYLERAA